MKMEDFVIHRFPLLYIRLRTAAGFSFLPGVRYLSLPPPLCVSVSQPATVFSVPYLQGWGGGRARGGWGGSLPGSVPSPRLQLWVGLGNTSVPLPRTQLALAPFLAFQRSEAGPPPPSQWQECGEERATNSRGSGFLCGHDGGIPGRFLAFIQKKRKLQFLPPAPGPPGPAPPPSPRLSCAPP